MKSLKMVLVASAMSFSAITCSYSATTDDVKAAYKQWNAAFNSGDAEKIASTYTKDAVFLPPTHDVIESSEGIQNFFDGLFKAGVTGHQLEVIKIMEDGDDIIVASKWSAKGKDGAAIGGIATHVFKKQADGSLKLALHTFN